MPRDNQAQEIFASALELTGEAREAFVVQATGHDPELQREVLRLLAQAERADSFFGLDSRASPFGNDLAAGPSEKPGDQVGPYILRQKIGEGGFGTVWMAEQSEPISRMVALKLIKAGMDTKQVLARFEAERQALALLDDPNIAKVLDAGATANGRPYFAMELVKGIPITRFCADQKHGIRRRLELFRDLCSAVNHAHQKGIIHRDLKPSNVLVTLHGDKPVVKVIDFGIAKATQGKLTDKTLFTHFEQFLGTPVYMSPEQAALSGLDIDTRSDIYSLGVLLYEVLTGAPPFDPKTLVSAGYDEMRRIIREDDPPKPSTKLMQSQAAAGASSPLPVSASSLQGEVDWMVMKAMDKDRSRRYETANAFAADIARYLANEPVVAAAPSAVYRLRKFTQRHRGPLVAGLAVATALVAGTVFSVLQMVQATQARDQEVEARIGLQQALKRAEEGESLARAEERRQRLTAYAADMNLAQAAVNKNDPGRARRLLDRHRPQQGEPDFRGWEWRYLWQLCRSQDEQTLSFGEGWIESMAVAPDHRWLAFRGVFLSTNKIVVWNLRQNKRVRELQVDGVPLAFAPNEAVLAFTESRDSLYRARGANRVRFLDLATGRTSGDLVLDSWCWEGRFSQDGKTLYTVTQSGVLTQWDWTLGRQDARFELGPRKDGLRSALVIDERRRVAFSVTGEHPNILELEFESGRQIQWGSSGGDGVSVIALSPDGSRLATDAANPGFGIRMWDTHTRKPVGELLGHTARISAVVYIDDGKTLASASDDRTIRLWDAETMKAKRVFKGHSGDICCLKVASEGRTLVSGGKDGSIRFWNPTRAPEEPAHRKMTIRPDGLESRRDWFARMVPWTFSADTQSLFVVDRSSGQVIRYAGSFFQDKQSVMDTGAGDCGIVFLPEAGIMAVGSDHGEVQVWDLDQEQVRERLPVGDAVVIPVAMIDQDTVWLWDVSASEVQEWHGGRKTKSVTLPKHVTSETLKWPLTSYNNSVICFLGQGLIDMRSQRLVELGRLVEVNNGFSHDGRWFAGPRSLDLISMWQVASLVPETMERIGERGGLPVYAGDMTPMLQLRGGPNGFRSVAFSADDTRLAGGGHEDEAVKIWETEGFHELITLPGSGFNFGITAFSPDGSLIGSVNSQGILHLWRAPTLDEIAKAERQGD